MNNPLFYAGDTGAYLFALRDGTDLYPLVVTDTVKALFIDPATSTAITAAVTQSYVPDLYVAAEGADWANGIVAVAFDSVNSALLMPFVNQAVTLEIEVARTGGGKRTFQFPMGVRKGFIP